jgi:hypothetical protein
MMFMQFVLCGGSHIVSAVVLLYLPF